ncbi:MAG: hypothetical protein AAF439_02285 [Pseudomonadota bacterium]
MMGMTRIAGLLALGLILTGCDEPTIISDVDKQPHMKIADFWQMQDTRGIPVEIHGSPFHRVADQALADALRPPAAAGDGIKFYSATPGSWQGGHAWRLVLHFQPQGGPNAPYDCKLVEEARTNERPEQGFTVHATFCKEDIWQAHGFMKALKIEDGNLAAFGDMMQALMAEIFRDPPDQ